jgi:hypothetical protein
MPADVDADITKLPLQWIEVDPENIRTHYDQELLDGFREVLRTGGEYINPPHVYPVGANRYRVKHGNTRVLAAQGLVDELPVRVVAAPSSAEDRVLSQLSENLVQGGLSPLDTARALQRLRKTGLSIRGIQEHLARYGVKRSVAWIHTTLKMLDLPPDVQAQIEKGDIKPWEAVSSSTSRVVRVPVEAMQSDFREHIHDLAVQLLNEPRGRRRGTKRAADARSGLASPRWEIMPMPGDAPELLEKAAEEGRQDVAMALNALRLLLQNGLPAKDSASGRLLRSRLRQVGTATR